MVLEDKSGSPSLKEGKGTRTGPKCQPLGSGRPEWQVYCGKLIYWYSVCGYWNTIHLISTKAGVTVPGYLDNTKVNGHQR
eukprot:15336667-Ditylum_brightwellii.AAC.1